MAGVVRACRPDVLCLQEAPRRPGTRHRTARLTDRIGLRQVAGGRRSGGTAVLVAGRIDVAAGEVAPLPVAHWWTRTRGVAVARLRLPGGVALTVASVHLPLVPDARVDHARRVRDRLAAVGPGPVVVCGDLNEPPGGPAWRVLGELCRDAVAVAADAADGDVVQDGRDDDCEPGAVVAAPTFPARSPSSRIDAVLVSPDVRVLGLRPAGPPDGLTAADLVAASDHLPLVAELVLPRREVSRLPQRC